MENSKYMEIFKAFLDREGIKYQEVEKDNAIGITYDGENVPLITVWAFFDESLESVLEVKSWEIGHVRKEKRVSAIRVCNEINREYRFISFFLDEKDNIIVRFDQVINEENCEKLCLAVTWAMFDAVDAAYPRFAKLLSERSR